MESAEKIKEAGLKVTPQRKIIYEAMMQLHHATVEDIVAHIHNEGTDMTISTVYRVLDSFCKVNLLGVVVHPETGRIYYDITVREHAHMFSNQKIEDYEDSRLLEMVRNYLETNQDLSGKISKVQIQITINNV